MRKLIYIIAVSVLAFQFPLLAQDAFKFGGRVLDSKGQPVIGAVVMLDGSSTVASVTDADGGFMLSIPRSSVESAKVTVSCISYKTQTLYVAGRALLDVVLEDDSEQLEEVVVVGYGAMRRSDLTGSVASVKIDEGDAGRSESLDQLIQGHVSGVQVTSNSAAPDAGVSMIIRGKTSLSGNSQPLYVIDGVILSTPDGSSMLNAGGDNGGLDEESNNLLGLNPQDIASIEILKDASATAIYGSEGANGVVLITTKMANREKPVIRFAAGLDLVTRTKRFPTLNFDEYVEYLEANTFNTSAMSQLKRMYSGYNGPEDRGTLAVTPVDWQDYSMRNTLRQRYYFSVSGRPNTLSYNFSIGYNRSPGVIKTTGVDQFTVRLNVEKELLKNLKIGTKINYAHVETKSQQGASAGEMSVSRSMMNSILVSRPYLHETDEEEDWDQTSEDLKSTPSSWLNDSFSNREQYRVTPNVYLQWNIIPCLTFKVTAGGDYNQQERTRWRGASVSSATTGANGYVSDAESIRWNIDNLLMFNKKIKRHSISATLGLTTDNRYYNTSSVVGYNIKQYKLQLDALNSSPNAIRSYSETRINTLSVFARAIYNYSDRYVLTATIRTDGSSKFSAGNKFAWFPSFAFAWRMNQEKWFRSNLVSMMKLRLGWGQVGNSGVQPYQTYVTFGNNRYPTHDPSNPAGYSVALSPSNLPNPELKWETTQQWNAGLDYGMWQGRLSLTLDAYYKMTYDLLNAKKLPYTSGFTQYYVNQGKILNKGIEFAFEAVPVKTGDWEWSIEGNISLNRNRIVDIGTDSEGDGIYLTPDVMTKCNYYLGDYIGGGRYFNAPANIFVEGQPIGLFYGLKTDGIVQEEESATGFKAGESRGPGYIRYVDVNKDGIISSDDRTVIGDPNPDFIYGFSTRLNWKNLTFSMAFNGSYGNDVCNSNLNMLMDTGFTTVKNVDRRIVEGAWVPGKTDARYPELGKYVPNEDSSQFSDLNIEDGSYLRLSNISVSYLIPIRKRFIRDINAGFTVRNVYVWTGYSGWDPEVSSFGTSSRRIAIDNGSYPSARSFCFDLKFTF